MNNYLDVPGLPIEEPQAMLLLQAIDKVDGIVNAYKEYKISESIEATKRVAYREQTKIEIKKLEEETRRYIFKSSENKEMAFKLIDVLNNILQTRELLDESTYNLCQSLIEAVVGAMK